MWMRFVDKFLACVYATSTLTGIERNTGTKLSHGALMIFSFGILRYNLCVFLVWKCISNFRGCIFLVTTVRFWRCLDPRGFNAIYYLPIFPSVNSALFHGSSFALIDGGILLGQSWWYLSHLSLIIGAMVLMAKTLSTRGHHLTAWAAGAIYRTLPSKTSLDNFKLWWNWIWTMKWAHDLQR